MLLVPTVRYLGTDENLLSLEAIINMYQLIASNLEQARKKGDTKAPVLNKELSEGDIIMFKDHTTGVCDPKYGGEYRIVCFPGRTQVEVVDSTCKEK